MQSKQSSDLIKATIALFDLGLITAAFYLAYWLRFDTLDDIESFRWLYYFSAPLILLLLLRHGVLTGFRYQKLRDIFKSTLVAFIIAGAISSTVLYLSKTADYSRLVFGIYFTLAAALVLLEKIVVKKLFDRHLKRGGMNIRIAMLGFGPKFEEIFAELRDRPQWGIAPVLVQDTRDIDVRQLVRQIRESIIDEVYIAYPRGPLYHEQIDKLLDGLEKLGLPVRLALNFDELQDYYGQHFCTMASKTGVMLAPYNLDPDQLIIKQCMDIAGAIVGLLFLALIYPFVAIAIKLDSPGPVFFSQIRVGKGGREFTLRKFRSMHTDAEARKHELLAHNMHDGPMFKMENDPRVSRVGRFIRKYSIDEIPQFWNVLTGDMSLVGTRPPTREEVAAYEDHHFRRISMKPGLTGLWQISGRNKISDFDQVVALDLQYIRNWSFRTDLEIILQTIKVVIMPGRGSGL
jgi:exopolysaccharide biosynthesis polyprenyl glycosylphosphotransferase